MSLSPDDPGFPGHFSLVEFEFSFEKMRDLIFSLLLSVIPDPARTSKAASILFNVFHVEVLTNISHGKCYRQ